MAMDEYQSYVTRFEAEVGALAVGAYGKWKGRLVKRLGPEEFATKHDELETLARTYQGILERGDTLNDAITKLLAERQGELLIVEDVR